MQTRIEFLPSSPEDAFKLIYSENWSAQDAYRYLSQDFHASTFAQTLRCFYAGEDIRTLLVDGLCQIDASNPASTTRKVRDWLSGKYLPAERDELIKICFILHLEEDMAGAFLSLIDGATFHLRNPWELVCAYCLRTHQTFEAAVDLYKSLPYIQPPAQERETLVLTKTISDAFRDIEDDASFIRFYETHHEAFGAFHNTAYQCFMRFINLLLSPSSTGACTVPTAEERYSVETVVSKYLRMHLPLNKQTGSYSTLQKTIRKFWPNTASVTRMCSREEDVTRRVLLLLYLVTEGGYTADQEDAYTLDEDFTDLERFEEHYWRLNSMLNDCGMSTLHPQHAFDWLILYALKTSGDEAMSERMEAVLALLF